MPKECQRDYDWPERIPSKTAPEIASENKCKDIQHVRSYGNNYLVNGQ